jgi:hypothetical protein
VGGLTNGEKKRKMKVEIKRSNHKWFARVKLYQDGRVESHVKLGRRIVKRFKGNYVKSDALGNYVEALLKQMDGITPTVSIRTAESATYKQGNLIE